ncbi:MAG: hypothetical protein Q3960_03625 [Lactobacillus sp.]|nr:hypothetical protein [Lactobacillus sp.]
MDNFLDLKLEGSDKTNRALLWDYFMEEAGNDARRAESMMAPYLNKDQAAVQTLLDQIKK